MEKQLFEIIYDWEEEKISADELYKKVQVLFGVKSNEHFKNASCNNYCDTTLD